MATQVIGADRQRRSRLGVILIAVALTIAVAVLAAQASSIWSTKSVSTVQPKPVSYSLSPKVLQQLSKRTVLPAGCRIKYGCHGTESTSASQP
jgi:hypothetical protein